jgi:anti-sigma B factor antagonist
LLDVSTVTSGPPVIVRAAGVLDINTVDELTDSVRPHLDAGLEVIVDFSGVTLCDSTGLGAVVRLERHARTTGARFALRWVRPHVAEVIDGPESPSGPAI